MSDNEWMNDLNFECKKCGAKMDYVGGNVFECKCGFTITVNDEFTWATIVRESCQVVK